MNGLMRERWYPLAVALAAAALWVYLGVKTPAPDALRDLYATSMSFAAITVGFLATAMSIVVSAPDGPLVRQLANSGYLEDLIRYLKEPFGVGILIATQCLVGFVLPESSTSHVAFGALWSGLVTWMLLGLYRMGTIFVKIMAHIGRLSSSKPELKQGVDPGSEFDERSQDF